MTAMKKEKTSRSKSQEKIGRRMKKWRITPEQEYKNRIVRRRKKNKLAKKSKQINRKK